MSATKKTKGTKRPTAEFSENSKAAVIDNAKILTNIQLLLQNLDHYDTKESVNNFKADVDIQRKFRAFLVGCDFHVSLSDLDETIKESNAKPRDDGSIGWHHQFSQVLLFLSEVGKGSFSLDDLNEHGGLEVAIRTILRHDSIEDFNHDFISFEEESKLKLERTLEDLQNRGLLDHDGIRREQEYKNLDQLMKNLRLLTKKITKFDKHGNPKKEKKKLWEKMEDYIQNMLSHEDANPVVYLIKTFDGTHNLSTMMDAPKFTAIRRRIYANDREDMYGGRAAMTEYATHKWPKFAQAIKNADALMGSVLYTNFGYLDHVDQGESRASGKSKFKDGDPIYPSGIVKYLSRAITFKTPRAFNPLHTQLDTIQDRAKNFENTTHRERAKKFWDQSLIPALSHYKKAFPKIFVSPASSAPAYRNQ